MTEFKPPWVEDAEYCNEKNIHAFVISSDGFVRCYYCGIDFREFRRKLEEAKEK